MMNNQTNIPKFILAAKPSESIRFSNFFMTEKNRYYDLLKNPPYLRYSGWNMLTLDTPKIKQGECWEVTNGDRKTIRLYEDGTLISSVYANDKFLGWGQSEEEFLKNPKLNTLALIEFVTEFVHLYCEIIAEKDVQNINFRIGFMNSKINDMRLQLSPQRIGDPFYGLIEQHMGKLEEDFMIDHLITPRDTQQYDAKYIAFDLLSIIFRYFGISSEKIPYTTKDEKGRYFIDVNSIENIR